MSNLNANSVRPPNSQDIFIDIPLQTLTLAPPSQPQSSWRGRCVSRLHCSQLCSSTGTVLGVATTALSGVGAYFAYIASNYTLFGFTLATGGLGATLAGISCVSTVYLCAWKPQKKLEQVITEVGEASSQLLRQKKDFENKIADLQKANSALQLLLDDEKRLKENAFNQLQTKTEEIQTLAKRLELINQSLEQARKLTEEWKKSAETITSQIDRFQPSNLHHEIEQLDIQISNSSAIHEDIENDVEGLHNLTQEMRALSSSWNSMIVKLNTTMSSLNLDIHEKRTALSEASQEIEKLKFSNRTLGEENHKLSVNITELQKLEKTYSEAVQKIEQLAPILQSPEFVELIHKLQQQQ